MILKDYYGQPLNIGDLVMRRRKGEDGDFFRCHPASFGIIDNFVIETWKTRPDVKAAKSGDNWSEVQIIPDKLQMLPHSEKIIQWSPKECIRLPKFFTYILRTIWPITRRLYTKPTDGRSTDW